ncbi:MAG: PilZ domain-containing protein [Bdellovibrionales bacterium]|nr:PilZ domain-containing protein [Bdellovibrionales bacterium]
MQGLSVSTFNHSLVSENLRSLHRFMIRDKRLWQLKIQDKKYPLDWVHNISRTGLQIRQGSYKGFQIGEIIEVELRFLGSTILKVEGKVVWLKVDSDHFNMNVLGIEFIETLGRPLKKWVSRQMFSKQALQLSDEVHHLEILEAQEVRRQKIFRFSETQWAVATVLPFVVGYLFGFFG